MVNKYEPDIKKSGGLVGGATKLLGSRFSGVGAGIKWDKTESMVQTTLQLIDLETSEIVSSKPIEIRLKKNKMDFGGLAWGCADLLGGFLSKYAATPIGQAMIASINVGVYEIVKEIGNQPVEGKVAAVRGSQVILNLGEGSVNVGDVVSVASKGEPIVDPDTGEILSVEEEVLGQLRIARVQKRVSYASPIGQLDVSRLKTGDIVRALAKPDEYEFAANWD